jgi:hypothetical protein
MNAEPVTLDDAIASLAAAFPLTRARAAANARLLDEEVAEYDEAHAGPDAKEPAT